MIRTVIAGSVFVLAGAANAEILDTAVLGKHLDEDYRYVFFLHPSLKNRNFEQFFEIDQNDGPVSAYYRMATIYRDAPYYIPSRVEFGTPVFNADAAQKKEHGKKVWEVLSQARDRVETVYEPTTVVFRDCFGPIEMRIAARTGEIKEVDSVYAEQFPGIVALSIFNRGRFVGAEGDTYRSPSGSSRPKGLPYKYPDNIPPMPLFREGMGKAYAAMAETYEKLQSKYSDIYRKKLREINRDKHQAYRSEEPYICARFTLNGEEMRIEPTDIGTTALVGPAEEIAYEIYNFGYRGNNITVGRFDRNGAALEILAPADYPTPVIEETYPEIVESMRAFDATQTK